MIPTIRNCQGSNPNDGGLCLEVNFNDRGPNEKAFLNRIDNCVHSGSFEKLEVAIAATSEECPTEETSTMQVSRPKIFQKDENMEIPGFSIFIKDFFFPQVTFSHPRSSDHLFFNVNPMTGMTMRVERSIGGRIVDEVLIDPDHMVTPGIGSSIVVPDAGYILDLVVFYDTSIAGEYGADVETR